MLVLFVKPTSSKEGPWNLVSFLVYEILLAMEKDSSQRLKALLVDGGMTKNDLLMQIQANFNGTFTTS